MSPVGTSLPSLDFRRLSAGPAFIRVRRIGRPFRSAIVRVLRAAPMVRAVPALTHSWISSVARVLAVAPRVAVVLANGILSKFRAAFCRSYGRRQGTFSHQGASDRQSSGLPNFQGIRTRTVVRHDDRALIRADNPAPVRSPDFSRCGSANHRERHRLKAGLPTQPQGTGDDSQVLVGVVARS